MYQPFSENYKFIIIAENMWNYLQIRYLVFIFLTTTCENCFCDNRNQMLSKVVNELCVNIPHGIYTLSIVQTDFSHNDSCGRLFRNELTFGAFERYYNHLNNKCDEKTDNRLLDYYCLIDTVDIALKNAMSTYKYSFETEQSISGYVKGTFKKVDNFVLKVFTPSTGEMQDLNVPNNRFYLKGLDFCDGTAFTLQAIRNNGNDKFLQLYIDSLQYPKVSVKKYHFPFVNINKVETAKILNPSNFIIPKFQGTIELPEVIAKGRRIEPMNRMKFDPDRAIGENDPLFEIAQTMEILVSRFGLHKGRGYVKDYSGDEEQILVEALGRVSRREFIPCEVMLDDNLVRGYALEEIPNMNPLDIKQMEYFLPSNYEMFGNFAGNGGVNRPIRGLYGEASKRGLLMIWTKSPTAFSHFKHRKPLSVVTVKHLGYMPQKTFDVRNTATFNPTKYWNPYFNPQDFDWNILKDVDLNNSTNYLIKIEGVSDDGVLISKQKLLNQ